MIDSASENIQDEHEEIISEEDDQNPSDLIQKIRAQIKTCEAERQEYLAGWQRAKADLVNARKDEERERTAFVRYAAERLIRELLPVLESFEMAFSNREAWEQAPEGWRTGIEYIHAQLYAALARNGLKDLNPLGETFDPTVHESAGEKPVERGEEDHVVVSVVRRGYKLYDKLIQPAKVVVGIYRVSGSKQ